MMMMMRQQTSFNSNNEKSRSHTKDDYGTVRSIVVLFALSRSRFPFLSFFLSLSLQGSLVLTRNESHFLSFVFFRNFCLSSILFSHLSSFLFTHSLLLKNTNKREFREKRRNNNNNSNAQKDEFHAFTTVLARVRFSSFTSSSSSSFLNKTNHRIF